MRVVPMGCKWKWEDFILIGNQMSKLLQNGTSVFEFKIVTTSGRTSQMVHFRPCDLSKNMHCLFLRLINLGKTKLIYINIQDFQQLSFVLYVLKHFLVDIKCCTGLYNQLLKLKNKKTLCNWVWLIHFF